MVNKTKQASVSVFKLPEGFKDMAPQAQDKAVSIWSAANLGAEIVPVNIPEGGLPAYLRRDVGKRADINRMLASPIPVAKFIVEARKLGGGWRDLSAALVGGYSRSAFGYGNPVVKVQLKEKSVV